MHLAGAHAYMLSGQLQVRDGVPNAGDYVYEPSGVLHDETTALEDTGNRITSAGSCRSQHRQNRLSRVENSYT